MPGADAYIAEKYALEIAMLLKSWSEALRTRPPGVEAFLTFVHPSVKAPSFATKSETALRKDFGFQVFRRRFHSTTTTGRDQVLDHLSRYLADFTKIKNADFEITKIERSQESPAAVKAEIRYELVGTAKDGGREQRIGKWQTEWSQEPPGWKLLALGVDEESVVRARQAMFTDVSSQAFGALASYKDHLAHGTDYWRTVLDGACGIDVYGNNGIACGDYDADGWDDIYVCQPAGLPNRLYRNRGDGTFEDVTQPAGVDVLDATPCALFADFENKGLEDLLVVCEAGPLLFLNQGNGKFKLKRDAFQFANPAEGTFTHAAVADYDHDGRLDVYFCLYNYYLGLEQYHYPVPYFDARNGPPNFLFHNQGNAEFQDRTQAAGLNVDNDRYSFACAWGDANGNGLPDLYVANDFGRNNLYRNNGDGTFASVATEAGVEDPGAGMSACWLDFDGNGKQDLYAGNMWSAAGMRVADQKAFHAQDPEPVRALYQRHARGNSLYRNRGDGHFENVSRNAGVEIGRWAWSSDSWDFDHDGFPDLLIANGYVSGTESPDLGSFFWRQLVAASPRNSSPSPGYERAWNAINELIRSDHTWNGYERNVAYINNRDGTFSDISGMSGLDFRDDGRAFALADLDHDGRLEVVLKNRTTPQLRLMRNVSDEIGSSISFRLQGTKSNRDAIGTAVTLEAGGRRQTKYLQAGSGFLSQHHKGLLFGIGDCKGPVSATVRWPSGSTQRFENLPVEHRIEVVEGSETFDAVPYGRSLWKQLIPQRETGEPIPSSVQSWLIEPLAAPDFALLDGTGKGWQFKSLQGKVVLLNFCSVSLAVEQLKPLRQHYKRLQELGLQVLGITADIRDPAANSQLRVADFPFPILAGTAEMIGTYNIIYRYLFDRHRDLPLPISFLVDEHGQIVKVYQGTAVPDQIVRDAKAIPRTPEERTRAALPFPGKLYQSDFQRNDFTYGVAFFQRGYLDQAGESFKQVIASRPNDAEAYYNLGTLYLRRNNQQAGQYLEQAVRLRTNYPEAWNNLGMLAAQEGDAEGAIRSFQQSLSQRPDYVTALVNLGNLYRRQKSFDEAARLLERAIALEPNNPEVNYSFGMLHAQQGDVVPAEELFQKAVRLQPDYAEALNNLGVLLVREQHYSEAEDRFKNCIQVAPDYDQAYLNLARLYVVLDRKENAKEVLQALLRKQPEHKTAQQALEMLQ